MKQPVPFDMGDIFQLMEVSNKIEVVLEKPNGEIYEDFGDCSFCKAEKENGFAFALMSKMKCIEFYVTAKQEALVFIYALGDLQQSSLGEGKVESYLDENENIESVFSFEGINLRIKYQRHYLKALPSDYEAYMSNQGDALGLKWLNVRNDIDRFKFDVANRVVSIGRIKNNFIVEMCKKANLYSVNIGDADNFMIDFVGLDKAIDTRIQINICDENKSIVEDATFKSLFYALSFASDNDFTSLRGCELKRNQDEKFITYFFEKDDESIAVIIPRNKNDDEQAYEMFSGIEFKS